MSRAKNDYLICYDISDEKRLARLARYLEKTAFRIQYSIFLLPLATNMEIKKICADAKELIDEEKDDLRVYTVANSGFKAGIAVDLDEPFIIV
jgi:CRISPR-associated protein Cas2